MKKEEISYSDDLTKEVSEDVRQINFGWLGTFYEIDLNASNIDKYTELLNPLIANARPIKNTPPQKPRRQRGKTDRENRQYSQAIRDFCYRQGTPVSPRGRVPKWAVEAYENRTNNEA